LEEAYSDTTGAVEVVEIARMPSGMQGATHGRKGDCHAELETPAA
jgi:hypothetical protein